MSNEVSRNLDSICNNLDTNLEKALANACASIMNNARQKAPSATGNLRRSIDFVVEGSEGVVYSNAEYAPYVEYGTGIYATKGNGRKKPWRYENSKGEWVTTRGSRAQPFFEPAVNESRSDIMNAFQDVIQL